MNLIINADDFGLTQGINDAILDLATLGSISSTTVMVNMPYWEQVMELLRFPNFGIGLHLNLTVGKPVCDPELIPTLLGENGEFLGQNEFRAHEKKGAVRVEEMHRELSAQYDRLYKKIGSRLDHLDSHQNIHKARGVAKALLTFGHQYPGLGLRAPYRVILQQNKLIPGLSHSMQSLKLKRAATDLYLWKLTRHYRKVFKTPSAELHAGNFRKLDLLKGIDSIPAEAQGCFEIACHPAKNTLGLAQSKLTAQRLEEYQLLSCESYRERFKPLTLIPFNSIL